MVLRASGVTKRYGGVTALSTVDISLIPGEVHGLVGENGAGKSTLVKILSGVVRPDGGAVEMDGTPVAFSNARDAVGRGVALVAQELAIFGDLTVAENLFPLDAPRLGPLLSFKRMAERAAPVLAELGLRVPVDTRAGTLSLADQQLVEIGRALLQQPGVLILDEPTSALPRDAVERLMSVLRALVDRGVAVLYVSHFLEEVLRIAQRVTVLRDGRAVLAGESDVDLDRVVTAMLGSRPAPAPVASRAPATGSPAVEVSSMSVGGLRDVSFSVASGEIVGFAGLAGAGHLTALAVLSGRAVPSAGQVRIGGVPAPRTPRQALRSGIAFVPSDRKRFGLMLDKAVWENTSAVSWLGIGRDGWWLRRRRLAGAASRHLERFRIRGGANDPTSSLSGGNQQKVVVAKWLDADPDVVILDDPARG
ncbi:MAG TPA: sugar ABC transporter ATP-binding protein, partial [Amycolatopsis sp.]|nr:sugar ABC transporter ATP-binding protein [Amycolatopsis sp.]